jgi:NADH dehydrogenase FAD-containing subunit
MISILGFTVQEIDTQNFESFAEMANTTYDYLVITTGSKTVLNRDQAQ